MLFELSPEQEKLIPLYREKWQKIALSTEAIAPQKAREAVERGYIAVGKAVPEFIFVNSPFAASKILLERLDPSQMNWSLLGKLSAILSLEIYNKIPKNIVKSLSKGLGFNIQEWYIELEKDINTKLQYQTQNKVDFRIASRVWVSRCSWYDFCISVLEFHHSDLIWIAFKAIVSNCGLVFAFEDICIICDRPRELNFDIEGNLSATGKPAIEFTDHYTVYAYQGRILSEKYGDFKIIPYKRKLEWFLKAEEPLDKTMLAASTGFLVEEIESKQLKRLENYVYKWSEIIFSTTIRKSEKIKNTIENIYFWLDRDKPRVIFCKSLKEILDRICSTDFISKLGFIGDEIFDNFLNQIHFQLNDDLRYVLNEKAKCFIIESQIDRLYGLLLEEWISSQKNDSDMSIQENNSEEEESDISVQEDDSNFIDDIIFISRAWLALGGYVDFCISVLNCIHDSKVWELYQNLAIECGIWIVPYEEICFVCDRPKTLSFDAENRPHAEGKPAIEFADGFSIYAYHGVRLPEKYGKFPPSQWRSQWILSEENAEVRRTLIQGIGYGKICQELQVVELDIWREYSLLRIDVDFDEELEEEPIYLLKMTCPSTEHIHVLRVPPEMNSAREAITWVNWDIDPEKFAMQT